MVFSSIALIGHWRPSLFVHYVNWTSCKVANLWCDGDPEVLETEDFRDEFEDPNYILNNKSQKTSSFDLFEGVHPVMVISSNWRCSTFLHPS